jgi:hypothetical protein
MRENGSSLLCFAGHHQAMKFEPLTPVTDARPYSLAICFTVWNRSDLFMASFKSLLRQLDGIQAGIWIFDNGSDRQTRALIEELTSAEHRVFKTFLPENMGIPFVVNIFSLMLTQDSQYAGYKAPDHVMLADADAYFKKPLRDMVEILESDSLFEIVSGHDSVEHASATTRLYNTARDEVITVKEKAVERGLCLMMRKGFLAACVPLPHDSNQDVDWQLTRLHANSIEARKSKLVAVDYVAHIGLYDSTWHPVGVPADRAEMIEIDQILDQEDLWTPDRRARMERYCSHFNLEITPPAKKALRASGRIAMHDRLSRLIRGWRSERAGNP